MKCESNKKTLKACASLNEAMTDGSELKERRRKMKAGTIPNDTEYERWIFRKRSSIMSKISFKNGKLLWKPKTLVFSENSEKNFTHITNRLYSLVNSNNSKESRQKSPDAPVPFNLLPNGNESTCQGDSSSSSFREVYRMDLATEPSEDRHLKLRNFLKQISKERSGVCTTRVDQKTAQSTSTNDTMFQKTLEKTVASSSTSDTFFQKTIENCRLSPCSNSKSHSVISTVRWKPKAPNYISDMNDGQHLEEVARDEQESTDHINMNVSNNIHLSKPCDDQFEAGKADPFGIEGIHLSSSRKDGAFQVKEGKANRSLTDSKRSYMEKISHFFDRKMEQSKADGHIYEHDGLPIEQKDEEGMASGFCESLFSPTSGHGDCDGRTKVKFTRRLFGIFSQSAPPIESKKNKILHDIQIAVSEVSCANLINLIAVLSVELIITAIRKKEKGAEVAIVPEADQKEDLQEIETVTEEVPFKPDDKLVLRDKMDQKTQSDRSKKKGALTFDLNGRIVNYESPTGSQMRMSYSQRGSWSNLYRCRLESSTRSMHASTLSIPLRTFVGEETNLKLWKNASHCRQPLKFKLQSAPARKPLQTFETGKYKKISGGNKSKTSTIDNKGCKLSIPISSDLNFDRLNEILQLKDDLHSGGNESRIWVHPGDPLEGQGPVDGARGPWVMAIDSPTSAALRQCLQLAGDRFPDWNFQSFIGL